MYRQEIKVLDCTIRDGGLMNNHLFSDELVRKVYQSANDAHIDYIELGYKADESQFSRSEFGPMKFCSEKDIEKVVDGIEKKVKISVMADIGRFDRIVSFLVERAILICTGWLPTSKILIRPLTW